MAKGIYYSDTENERLLRLYKDNKKKSYADIAEMAISYGVCTGRTARGIAQHLSQLVTPPAENSDVEQIAFEDMESFILQKENRELREELDSLLSAILDTATLYGGYALHLDFKAITRWMFKYEPERTNARIETLRMERGETEV